MLALRGPSQRGLSWLLYHCSDQVNRERYLVLSKESDEDCFDFTVKVKLASLYPGGEDHVPGKP